MPEFGMISGKVWRSLALGGTLGAGTDLFLRWKTSGTRKDAASTLHERLKRNPREVCRREDGTLDHDCLQQGIIQGFEAFDNVVLKIARDLESSGDRSKLDLAQQARDLVEAGRAEQAALTKKHAVSPSQK